jgi:hypothetical protein
MSLINFDDMPDIVAEWEKVAKFFNIEIDEEDVWELARVSEEIPLFHNIYMVQLVRAIKRICTEKYGLDDFTIIFHINSIDSHLYVNHVVVNSRDDFFGYLAKHLLTSVCIDDNEEIDEDFKIGDTTFETGTDIHEVWHYIEEHFNIAIGEYIGA